MTIREIVMPKKDTSIDPDDVIRKTTIVKASYASNKAFRVSVPAQKNVRYYGRVVFESGKILLVPMNGFAVNMAVNLNDASLSRRGKKPKGEQV